MDVCMDGWGIEGWMDEWMNGWMYGWMKDRGIDEWMDEGIGGMTNISVVTIVILGGVQAEWLVEFILTFINLLVRIH